MYRISFDEIDPNNNPNNSIQFDQNSYSNSSPDSSIQIDPHSNSNSNPNSSIQIDPNTVVSEIFAGHNFRKSLDLGLFVFLFSRMATCLLVFI